MISSAESCFAILGVLAGRGFLKAQLDFRPGLTIESNLTLRIGANPFGLIGPYFDGSSRMFRRATSSPRSLASDLRNKPFTQLRKHSKAGLLSSYLIKLVVWVRRVRHNGALTSDKKRCHRISPRWPRGCCCSGSRKLRGSNSTALGFALRPQYPARVSPRPLDEPCSSSWRLQGCPTSALRLGRARPPSPGSSVPRTKQPC